MTARNQDLGRVRRLQADVLRQAARIAESEASLLAVEYWNHACHRIAQRLEAQAACLEAEVVELPAAPEPKVHHRPRCRTSPSGSPDQRRF